VIATCCDYLNRSPVNLDDRHIERAAAQVVHHSHLIATILNAEVKSRGYRLIYDFTYMQPRKLTSGARRSRSARPK